MSWCRPSEWEQGKKGSLTRMCSVSVSVVANLRACRGGLVRWVIRLTSCRWNGTHLAGDEQVQQQDGHTALLLLAEWAA